jgi:hypothetical protein
MTYNKTVAIVCIFSSLILAPHCYGYIDMSTGSYILQILLASIVGIFFLLRTQASKVKSFLSRFFKNKTDNHPL